MVLFLISMLAVVLSSYMIAGCLNREKNIFGLIYMFLISFANVVLTMEVLSLFSAISKIGILVLNFIMLTAVFIFWKKQGAPLWSINCRPFFKKVWLACCKDKYLLVLAAAYLFIIGVTVFMTVILPAKNPDAASYHMLRSTFWIHNHNLNHFNIADFRAVCMPINSEILYTWVLIFVKKIIGIGFFEFFGYSLSIISIWKVFDYLKVSVRPRLWAIFILTAFPAVIVQMSGSETDMIIAGLVSSSILMYWYSIKEEKIKKIPLFMSALAYALAIGTKTPSIIAIPAVGTFMLVLSLYYKKKDFYKPFLMFLGFGMINFTIFSSYNYILNFLDFGDIRGNSILMHQTSLEGGLKEVPANFIKHLFLLVDFTGFRWGEYFGDKIEAFCNGLINFLHFQQTQDMLWSREEMINQSLVEPLMGLGICGIIAFIPALCVSLIAPLFKKSLKHFFLCGFGIMFLLNLIFISVLLTYMSYSIRFIMFFVVLSSPILVYTYSKKNNPYKFITTLFALYYLIFVSSYLWSRPLRHVVNYLRHGYSVQQIREISYCSNFMKNPLEKSEQLEGDCQLRNLVLKNFTKQDKILYLPSSSEPLLAVSMLNMKGYNIDFGLLEKFSDIDFSKYDAVIIKNGTQFSNLLFKFMPGVIPVVVLTAEESKFPEYSDGCLYCGLDVNKKYFLTNPAFVRCSLSGNLLSRYGFKLYKNVKVESLDENLKVYSYYWQVYKKVQQTD